jgi:hypothetical protein
MTVIGLLSCALALEGGFVTFKAFRGNLGGKGIVLALLPPLALLSAAEFVSAGAVSLALAVGGTYFGLGAMFGGFIYAAIEDGRDDGPPEGRDDDPGPGPEPEPSWWPDFETRIRDYRPLPQPRAEKPEKEPV